MRSILTTIFLMVTIAGASVCVAADEEKKSSSEPATPKQTQPAKKDSKKRTAPAPVFTPSEKVGADSAVSFPVDI